MFVALFVGLYESFFGFGVPGTIYSYVY